MRTDDDRAAREISPAFESAENRSGPQAVSDNVSDIRVIARNDDDACRPVGNSTIECLRPSDWKPRRPVELVSVAFDKTWSDGVFKTCGIQSNTHVVFVVYETMARARIKQKIPLTSTGRTRRDIVDSRLDDPRTTSTRPGPSASPAVARYFVTNCRLTVFLRPARVTSRVVRLVAQSIYHKRYHVQRRKLRDDDVHVRSTSGPRLGFSITK